MSLLSKMDTSLKPYTLPPTWRWFSLMTCILFGFFLFLLGLTSLTLPNLWQNVSLPDWSFLAGTIIPKQLSYSPQWWGYALLFCTLGVRWARFVYGLLLISALFLPVFAEGGSWQFWFTPSFSYLLGSFFALTIMSQKWQFLLKYTYSPNKLSKQTNLETFSPKRSPLRLWWKGILLVLWTVFTLHFIGTLGLGLLVLLQQLSLFEATQWWLTHTLYSFPYDYAGILIALIGIRYWRLLFRFFLYSPEKPKHPSLEPV